LFSHLEHDVLIVGEEEHAAELRSQLTVASVECRDQMDE
jgi:hypothetical protein